MDPLTITTACVSLLGAVAALSKQISSFVSIARNARKDMDQFSRELTSLALCLETLREDDAHVRYPEALKRNLIAILANVDHVTKEMDTLLKRCSAEGVGQSVKWSVANRDEAVRLRDSLEAHKSAIEIALELGSLTLATAIKRDVSVIKRNVTAVAGVREDLAQLSDLKGEITALRMQLLSIQDSNATMKLPLQRFLDESVAYAESVADPFDDRLEFETGSFVESTGPDFERTSIVERSPMIPQFSIDMNNPPLDLHAPGYSRRQGPFGRNDIPDLSRQTTLLNSPDVGGQNLLYFSSPPSDGRVSTLSQNRSRQESTLRPRRRCMPIPVDVAAVRSAERNRGRLSDSKLRVLDTKMRDAVVFTTNKSMRAILVHNISVQESSMTKMKKYAEQGASLDGMILAELEGGPREKIIQFLISRGAKLESCPDVIREWLKEWSQTTGASTFKVMEQLLSQGFLGPPEGNNGANTAAALHSAISLRELQLLQLLLDFGTSPDLQDSFGMKPAESACLHGWVEGLELLLSYRADVTMAEPGLAAFQGANEAINRKLRQQVLEDQLSARKKGDVGSFEYRQEAYARECARAEFESSIAGLRVEIQARLEQLLGVQLSHEDLTRACSHFGLGDLSSQAQRSVRTALRIDDRF